MSKPSLERMAKIKSFIKNNAYLTREEFEILLEMISDYGSDEYQEGVDDGKTWEAKEHG